MALGSVRVLSSSRRSDAVWRIIEIKNALRSGEEIMMPFVCFFLVPILQAIKKTSDVAERLSEKLEALYTGLIHNAENIGGLPHPPSNEDILAVLTDNEKNILEGRRASDPVSLLNYVTEEETTEILARLGW
jgi:hypothetical protein